MSSKSPHLALCHDDPYMRARFRAARKNKPSTFREMSYYKNSLNPVLFQKMVGQLAERRDPSARAQAQSEENVAEEDYLSPRKKKLPSVRQLEFMHDKTAVNVMVKKAKFYLEGNKDAALALFKKVAQEVDGELNYKQFNSAFQVLGLAVDDREMMLLWCFLDANGDQRISPEEIVDGLSLDLDASKKLDARYRKYRGWKRPNPPPLFPGVTDLPEKWTPGRKFFRKRKVDNDTQKTS